MFQALQNQISSVNQPALAPSLAQDSRFHSSRTHSNWLPQAIIQDSKTPRTHNNQFPQLSRTPRLPRLTTTGSLHCPGLQDFSSRLSRQLRQSRARRQCKQICRTSCGRNSRHRPCSCRGWTSSSFSSCNWIHQAKLVANLTARRPRSNRGALRLGWGASSAVARRQRTTTPRMVVRLQNHSFIWTTNAKLIFMRASVVALRPYRSASQIAHCASDTQAHRMQRRRRRRPRRRGGWGNMLSRCWAGRLPLLTKWPGAEMSD